MNKIFLALTLIGILGFNSTSERPKPLIDVVEFAPAYKGYEDYRWCLNDANYIRLIKHEQELNHLIDYYENEIRLLNDLEVEK